MLFKINKIFKESTVYIRVYYQLTYISNLIQMYRYFFLKGLPPEYLKRKFIQKLVKGVQFENAFESGTYFGKTTTVLSKYIKNVITVEIDQSLFKFASKRNILARFILGDSRAVLSDVIPSLRGSTLFYLDAHTSGGITGRSELVTPLKFELDIISEFSDLKNSIILIDDAISLNGQSDYPDLQHVINLARKLNLICVRTRLNSVIICNKDKLIKIREFYEDLEYLF